MIPKSNSQPPEAAACNIGPERYHILILALHWNNEISKTWASGSEKMMGVHSIL